MGVFFLRENIEGVDAYSYYWGGLEAARPPWPGELWRVFVFHFMNWIRLGGKEV